MNRKHLFFGLLLFCGTFQLMANPIHSTRFLPQYSLSQGKVLAKQQNQMLLALFGADWCMPSVWMEKKLIEDPALTNIFRQSFVPIKINIDAPEGARDQKAYQVDQLPTLIIFGPDGQQLMRLEGMKDQEELLQHLEMLQQGFSKPFPAEKVTGSELADLGVQHLSKPALLTKYAQSINPPETKPIQEPLVKPIEVVVELAVLDAYRDVLRMVAYWEQRLNRKLKIVVRGEQSLKKYHILADGFENRRSAFHFKQQLQDMKMEAQVQMLE